MNRLELLPGAGAVALTLLLLPPPVVGQAVDNGRQVEQYGQEIRRKSEVLDSIEGELAKGKKRLADLQKQEESTAAQLDQIEENVALAEAYLAAVAKSIAKADSTIGVLTRHVENTRRQLAGRQALLRQRLRAMYRARDWGAATVVMQTSSVSEAFNRLRYFRALREYDAHLLRAIDSARSDIESQKAVLEQQRATQHAFKVAKQREQADLVATKRERESLVKSIQAEKRAFLAHLESLREEQRQLVEIIKALEKKRAQARKAGKERGPVTDFEKRKGRLPWPVSGSVVRQFGRVVHPVYKTVTMNNGIDIRASTQDAQCVAAGSVVYIGRMRGLGRFVVVEHQGGYLTIYANLNSVAVPLEQAVASGATIGAVGEAGVSDSRQLHFEIRKSTESLDPMDWLEDVNR